jgi:transcription antitermination protein NusB
VAGRHVARRVALDILFQADVTGRDALAVLGEWESAGEAVPEFATELVRGVAAERDQLDRVIGDLAEAWSVERMAAVDRAILRLAAYELRSRPDVPTAVAIDEAVEAAKELSTAESGRFVNGILGRIAEGREDRAGREPGRSPADPPDRDAADSSGG